MPATTLCPVTIASMLVHFAAIRMFKWGDNASSSQPETNSTPPSTSSCYVSSALSNAGEPAAMA